MMKKMISQESEKNERTASEDVITSEKENTILKEQILILQDLINLRDESYYRQQILRTLERQTTAMEEIKELLISLTDSK